MAGPRQSPGWYPDPDERAPSATLRYWDGQAWTDRRRPQPVLATLELSGQAMTALEGPVRLVEPAPAPPPAPKAEINAARREQAPAGRPIVAPTTDQDQSQAPRLAGDRAGGDPPVDPGGPGGGGGDGDGGAGPKRKSRRKWWLLSGVAVLAAVAMGLAGQAMKPASPGPRALTDRQFVAQANAECVKTMPTLRPPDGGPLGGDKLTPAQTAGQIDAAATGLEGLANRLAALPAADPDRPHITGWLDGWHGFVAVGHQYADFLRQNGANQNKPPPVLQTGARLAKAADNFAQANSLKACTFAFVPVTDPSSM